MHSPDAAGQNRAERPHASKDIVKPTMDHAPYYNTDALSLRPLFGASYRPLSPDALLSRFTPLAAERQFYLTALGDTEPSPKEEFERYVRDGFVRAFIREGAKDADADPVLFLSVIVGLPLAFRWSVGGFDEKEFPEDVLVLADAMFMRNPNVTRVSTTLFTPPPRMAEESLAAWGFERVGRPSDVFGTKSWGIARDVCDMVLGPLREALR